MALRTVLAGVAAIGLALPVWADARITVLMDVIRLSDLVAILGEEGRDYGRALDEDMLGGEGGAFFQAQVDRIYDPNVMAEQIRSGFEEHLNGEDLEVTIDFFASDLGQRVISMENAAREAMIDPDVEEAAQALFLELRADNDPRLEVLDRFVALNDLIDRNVTAAMSSNLAFYRGLVDGKYLTLTQDQMLQRVWEQEGELRADTEDWLYGYFLLAYQSLRDDELETYVAFSGSQAGQSMNRALFAGHEELYRELSYALGRAVALSAAGSTL